MKSAAIASRSNCSASSRAWGKCRCSSGLLKICYTCPDSASTKNEDGSSSADTRLVDVASFIIIGVIMKVGVIFSFVLFILYKERLRTSFCLRRMISTATAAVRRLDKLRRKCSQTCKEPASTLLLEYSVGPGCVVQVLKQSYREVFGFIERLITDKGNGCAPYEVMSSEGNAFGVLVMKSSNGAALPQKIRQSKSLALDMNSDH